jgi:hypothetical protein
VSGSRCQGSEEEVSGSRRQVVNRGLGSGREKSGCRGVLCGPPAVGCRGVGRMSVRCRGGGTCPDLIGTCPDLIGAPPRGPSADGQTRRSNRKLTDYRTVQLPRMWQAGREARKWLCYALDK